MTDEELRDKLASGWASGSNRHGLENIYASASESFCAGWDAAMANLETMPASMYLKRQRDERDQLRAEIERLKGELAVTNIIAKGYTQKAHNEIAENASLKAQCEKLAEALEKCLSHVMLPHQRTHDGLICECNKAVSTIQGALGEYRAQSPKDPT